MPSRSTHSRPLALLLFGALIGCASRAVPTNFPPSSAASPGAAEAPPAPVTGALTADPPLPGQSVAQWPGLRADEGAPPSDHGGHHGH